jgi:hypothetical protein
VKQPEVKILKTGLVVEAGLIGGDNMISLAPALLAYLLYLQNSKK